MVALHSSALCVRSLSAAEQHTVYGNLRRFSESDRNLRCSARLLRPALS
eukprot:COSAG06_NODE_36261_length_449_cov_1.174286_2_plen_48_part_01